MTGELDMKDLCEEIFPSEVAKITARDAWDMFLFTDMHASFINKPKIGMKQVQA